MRATELDWVMCLAEASNMATLEAGSHYAAAVRATAGSAKLSGMQSAA